METTYAFINNTTFEDVELAVKLPQYSRFVKKYGHEPKKITKSEDEKRLAYWVEYQNNLLEHGLLTKNQKIVLATKNTYNITIDKELKELRKDFDLFKPKYFEDLEIMVKLPKFSDFFNKNGRGPLTISDEKEELWLACWQNYQNKLIMEGLLTKKQQNIFETEGLGRLFSVKEGLWVESFENYSNFVQKNKRLPYAGKDMKPGEHQIVRWFNAQIVDRNGGRLTNEHYLLLGSISFAFNKELSWDENFELCKEFLYNNKRLPTHVRNNDGETYSYEEKRLTIWLRKQINSNVKGELTKERFEKLESLGVSFPAHIETPEEHWEKMFQKYISFKQEFGREPLSKAKYKLSNIKGDKKDEEQVLGNWVRRQIFAYKKGVLKLNRAEKLKEAGLNLEGSASWEYYYHEVKKYMKAHGEVPKFGEPSNKTSNDFDVDTLAGWVCVQGKLLNEGKISKEQYKRLVRAKIDVNNKKIERKEISNFFEHIEEKYSKKL